MLCSCSCSCRADTLRPPLALPKLTCRTHSKPSVRRASGVQRQWSGSGADPPGTAKPNASARRHAGYGPRRRRWMMASLLLLPRRARGGRQGWPRPRLPASPCRRSHATEILVVPLLHKLTMAGRADSRRHPFSSTEYSACGCHATPPPPPRASLAVSSVGRRDAACKTTKKSNTRRRCRLIVVCPR